MKAKIFLLAILLTSCLSYKLVDLTKISIGMEKEEVFKKIGKPDNIIGAKNYPEGLIEVVQYTQYDAWAWSFNAVKERYWLYFLNGKLKQWGRPGDWQREADKVYELRVR